MTAVQMRELMSRKPFQPFRVRVSDGRTYEIHRREFNIVGESVVLIGVSRAGERDPDFPDYHDFIPYKLIDGIDLLPQPSTTSVR
jgi:hypothetical protein